MKKTSLLFVLAVFVFMVLASCTRTDIPTIPEEISTPNAVQTAVAGLTYTSLVSVPGGTFTQESDANRDGDVLDTCESFVHAISAFCIGKYEVTNELWYAVYQWAISNGYTFAHEGSEGQAGTITSKNYEPVIFINWRDVIVWCNAYSQMTGRTPVYFSDSGFMNPLKDSIYAGEYLTVDTTPGSLDNPYVNWSADGFRLPTEGEWQYAASYKDGSNWTPNNFASGAGADYTDNAACSAVAWHGLNSGSDIHDVGDISKTPNALGIHDMSGNAMEWCWDWSGDYPTAASSDYKGFASGSYRVVRGGSYLYPLVCLQVGDRSNSIPGHMFYDIGFRVARTL